MRLWSLHPSLLDAKGLVACWRESLLAQKVLAGQTRGYTNHPQLVRFRAEPEPLIWVGRYLDGLWQEATARGYAFDRSRILHGDDITSRDTMPVTEGQLHFEAAHLLGKLTVRDPQRADTLQRLEYLRLHPIFHRIPGPVETWEKDARATG